MASLSSQPVAASLLTGCSRPPVQVRLGRLKIQRAGLGKVNTERCVPGQQELAAVIADSDMHAVDTEERATIQKGSFALVHDVPRVRKEFDRDRCHSRASNCTIWRFQTRPPIDARPFPPRVNDGWRLSRLQDRSRFREAGCTLSHEHVLCDLWAFTKSYDGILDDESLAIRELSEYGDAGGSSLIDATSVGLGRNPLALRRISQATGIRIIMGSGWYRECVLSADRVGTGC